MFGRPCYLEWSFPLLGHQTLMKDICQNPFHNNRQQAVLVNFTSHLTFFFRFVNFKMHILFSVVRSSLFKRLIKLPLAYKLHLPLCDWDTNIWCCQQIRRTSKWPWKGKCDIIVKPIYKLKKIWVSFHQTLLAEFMWFPRVFYSILAEISWNLHFMYRWVLRDYLHIINPPDYRENIHGHVMVLLVQNLKVIVFCIGQTIQTGECTQTNKRMLPTPLSPWFASRLMKKASYYNRLGDIPLTYNAYIVESVEGISPLMYEYNAQPTPAVWLYSIAAKQESILQEWYRFSTILGGSLMTLNNIVKSQKLGL